MSAGDRIARLRAHGFVLSPLPNLLGDVDGIYAARTVPGYVDAVVLRGEECAVAARVRNVFDIADPFHRALAMWSKLGTVVEVADAVLARPVVRGVRRRTRPP